MGRFYKTAKPQFVNDIIYQPPWELMQQAMSQKQKKYDDTLGAIELFKGQLDIKHRQSEADTRAAQEIAGYYEDKVQNLANELYKNPDKVRDIQLEIGKLGRELNDDRKYGDISKLEGTYNQYQNYLKGLEDLKKKDPKAYDSTTANAGLQYFDKVWGGDTLNKGIWSGEDLINRPDIMNANNVVDLLKKIPEYRNAESIIEDDKRSGYIITRNGEQEFVSADRLRQTLDSAVYSDPTLSSYLQQQQKFGVQGANYYNENGEFIKPYEMRYSDSQGRIYSAEEVQKMNPTQQKQLKSFIDPANNPLGALYGLVEPLAYQKEKADTKLTYNQSDSQARKFEHDRNMENMKHLHNLDRDNNKHANKLDELIQKGEITPQEVQTEILLTQDVVPFTQQEYDQKLTDFVNLNQKLNSGQNISGAEVEKYDNLKTFYSGLADKFQMSLEDFTLLQQLKSNPNFGMIESSTSGPSSPTTGAPITYSTSEKSPERLRAEEIEKQWEKNVGKGKDFNKMVMEKAAMEEVVYVPSMSTPEGKATIGLFNAALSTGDYGVYQGDAALFDENGNLRPSRRLNNELDTGFWDGISDDEAGAQPLQYIMGKLGGQPMDYLPGAKISWQGDYGIVRGTLSIPPGRQGDFDQDDLDDFQGQEVAFVVDRTKSQTYQEVLKNSDLMKSEEGRSWYLNKTNPQFATTKNAVSMALSQLPDVGSKVKYHNTGITFTKVGQQQGIGQNGSLVEISGYPGQYFTEPELRAIMYGVPKRYSQEQKQILDTNIKEVLKRRTNTIK